MHRLFLDANVLFSAAYIPGSRLSELWTLPDTELVTSSYALEEARRNLLIHSPQQLEYIEVLASKMDVTSSLRTGPLPEEVVLPDKDIPILLAAIDSRCSHLITGDVSHFGVLFDQTVSGVLIQTPGGYLKARMKE